jgi:hypothetical protein
VLEAQGGASSAVNMREVSTGDVVFSFCDTRVKSIGVVTGGAQTGPKPDFGAAGSNWS